MVSASANHLSCRRFGTHVEHSRAFNSLQSRLLAGYCRTPSSTRRMVLTLIPVCREIARHEAPEARSDASFFIFTATLGRPSRLPLARAAARPLRTLSQINSRSNSAMLAKIPKTRRPLGVEVSTPSWRLMNSIPSERNSSRALTNCRRLPRICHTDRPPRSPQVVSDKRP